MGSGSLGYLASCVSRNWSMHLAAPQGGEGGRRAGDGGVHNEYCASGRDVGAGGVGAGQERGGQLVVPPKNLPWAMVMIGLQERILKEWRRRDRKAAAGLLAEVQEVESCGRGLMEVVEEAAASGGGGALLERERAQEVAERVTELAEAGGGARATGDAGEEGVPSKKPIFLNKNERTRLAREHPILESRDRKKSIEPNG